jgi:DNA-binding SARP family transcriptional activator
MDFRILGPLEVDDGGRPVKPGGARQRALLAILLLHRGEVVSAERIVEDLYGGRPPPTASKSLQAHVSRLRKSLGDARLMTHGRGYLLVTGPDEVDADRFVGLYDTGRAALDAGDAGRAEEALADALGLWRGTPLGELAFEAFAQSEAARLEELRLVCLELLADARLALGRHGEVVADLERLADEHPLREGFRARLMLALYRSGRQADALACYQDTRRRLVEELGIEPGRALQGLERAILNHDPGLDPPHTGGTAAEAAPPERGVTGSFVGRGPELDVLRGALTEARRGRGQFVLVSGEAGIGKTRLVDELALHAESLGVQTLWGRCWEAGGAPAYWPWIQALRAYVRDQPPADLEEQLGTEAQDVAHLLPELRELFPDIPEAALPESEGARFRLFDSTAAFLRRAADRHTLLFVLDDIHAADASSLLLIAFLTSELRDARVAIVATYREPELEPDDPTSPILADVSRHAQSRITLRGLGEHEVASYIEQTAREAPSTMLSAAIAAETDGNPLFVGEIVRLLAADGSLPRPLDGTWRPVIPETVKDAIGRRLQRLSPGCRQTLSRASVVGRDFSLGVLEALDSVPPAEVLERLDEAIVARLVTNISGAPGVMRFTHALVRDTLYESVPQSRRRELHRRTAETLERLAGPSSTAHLSELAHHSYQALPAAEPAIVVAHARRAALNAATVLAFEEAARLYEDALQAATLAPTDPALELDLLVALGEAHTGAGDTTRAKDAFLRAAVVARDHGTAEQFASAALGYGGKIVWARPRGDRLVVALLEEALTRLGPDPTALQARVLARLTGALRDERDPARRLEIGERAVAAARHADDPGALIPALLGLSVAQYAVDDADRRIEVLEELHALARAADDREAEWEALNAKVILSAAVNDFSTSREQTRMLVELSEERRQPSQRWFAQAMAAMFALHTGDYTNAETWLAEAHELGRHAYPDEARSAYVSHLYLLQRERGQPELAHDALREMAVDSPARPFFRCALAALAVDLGRTTEARRLLEELAPDRFEIVPRDNEWPLSAAFLIEVCWALGDASRAEIFYRELAPLAERSSANPPEGTLGAMARSLGIAAALAGREDEATAHLHRAIEIDESTGAVPWVAYAQVELADVFVAGGREVDASTLRARAGETAAALGMRRLEKRIEASTAR